MGDSTLEVMYDIHSIQISEFDHLIGLRPDTFADSLSLNLYCKEWDSGIDVGNIYIACDHHKLFILLLSRRKIMNVALMKLKLSTIVMIGVLACLASLPVAAQTSQPSGPLQDLQPEDPNDPNNIFTNRGGTGSLLNILNRLQQVNGQSNSEFAEDQSADFNSAVDSFRQKQQQQLGNPPPSTPASETQVEVTP